MWDIAGGEENVDILTNGAMLRLVVQYRARVLLDRRSIVPVVSSLTDVINSVQYVICVVT